MADTGFKTPTTTPSPGTANDWTNPANGKVEDGVFATVTITTAGTLKNQAYGTFGFSIPTGSTILGIEAIIKGKHSTGFAGNTEIYTQKGFVSPQEITLSTTNAQHTVGGPTDLWGQTWAASDFSDANFQLLVAGGGSGSTTTWSLDGVQVKVYYTPPAASVTTSAVTNNTALGTATGNGNVTSDGGSTITERGTVMNTTGTPTTADTKVTAAGTTGAYTTSLTGLIPGQTYYVRAYATNANGTFYGSTVSFTAVNFLNPTNAYSEDGSFMTAGGDTGVINVELSGDGGSTWSNRLSKTFNGTLGFLTYGAGSTELWGEPWLGSNVSNTNFKLRLSMGTRTGYTHIYKTFGFAPGSSVIITGIEVKIKAKWITDTTSVDVIQIKVYYGSSVLPIVAGSQAFATDAAGGSGALEVYNGAAWKEIADTSSTQTLTGKTFDTAGTGNVFKINGTSVTDKTGTGKMVLDTSPTIVTPTVASFANANHNHSNSAGGGQLAASAFATGAISGDKIDSGHVQVLQVAPGGSTDATLTGSMTDWITIGTAAIPSWCTKVYVMINIQAYYGVTSATEHDVKAVLGSDSGRTFKIGRSTVSSNDKTAAAWSDVITPAATGNQTLKLQAQRTSGTGSNRLDANSDVTATLIYL